MKNIDCIYKYIDENMSDKRKRHTEGVRTTAIRLAQRYGADPVKAELASLYHDLYRGVGRSDLNMLVRELGLDEKRYLDNANLAHGKIAAAKIQTLFGEEDPDIINAVSYHTTGRRDMSILEKVVFIADAIEPGRDYPGVEELRETTERDIDRGCLASLEGTCRHLEEQGIPVDVDTQEAIRYFKEIIGE